jgi:hypothetical protein
VRFDQEVTLKAEVYDGIVDFDRGYYEVSSLATKSNVLQPVLIKTSDPVLDQSTTSRSSASLPRNLTGNRQEGVVRYDHVDAYDE